MKRRDFIKKMGLFSVVVLFSTTAISQELFPELGILNTPKPAQTAQPVAVPESSAKRLDTIEENVTIDLIDNNDTDTPLAEQIVAVEQVKEQTDEQAQPEEEEDENDNRRIRMYLDDVDSTLAPVRTMSFCFATIKLFNQLKKPITSFQATLTYGQIPIKFTASNVAPNGTATQQLTLAGTACESMLDTPQINITKCLVPDMQEKRCKSRFIFEPYEETF